MILIRKERVIVYIKHNQNLFILDIIKLEKVITVDHRRLIYIISKNKQI